MPRRLLVTGAQGFIGTHFVRAMEQASTLADWTVSTWDRYIHESLLGPNVERNLAREAPDALLHLAWAATGTADYESSAENVVWATATARLAKACADQGIWFIGTGTCLEKELPPTSGTYVRAKVDANMAARTVLQPNLLTWVRPYWVVSLEDARPRVVRAALEASRSGAVFEPKEAGRRLDFIDVEDVATALVAIVMSATKGEIDIGSGRLRSVHELISLLPVRMTPLDEGAALKWSVSVPASLDRLERIGWYPAHTEALFGRGPFHRQS